MPLATWLQRIYKKLKNHEIEPFTKTRHTHQTNSNYINQSSTIEKQQYLTLIMSSLQSALNQSKNNETNQNDNKTKNIPPFPSKLIKQEAIDEQKQQQSYITDHFTPQEHKEID